MNHPQVTEFRTGTYGWFVLDASDVDSALNRAYRTVVPGVTFALSYMAGFSIQARFLCAYDAQTGENLTYLKSPVYQEVAVHAPDERFAHRTFDVMKQDSSLGRACHFLDQARRLWDASATVEEVDATLRDMSILHYAKTIECLANDARVNPQSRQDDELLREHEGIVGSLQKTLGGRRKVSHKIGAISEANTRIGKSRNQYLDLKVGRLAEQLELPPPWTQRAKQLTKVRNRNIAHAGALLTTEERDALFRREKDGRPTVDNLAETAVIAFLLKYLLYEDSQMAVGRGSSYVPREGASVHLDWK